MYNTGGLHEKWSLKLLNINEKCSGTTGVKGVVCGPEGARIADNRVPTKLRKHHLFLPSPTHACPRHGPWAMS